MIFIKMHTYIGFKMLKTYVQLEFVGVLISFGAFSASEFYVLMNPLTVSHSWLIVRVRFEKQKKKFQENVVLPL